MDNVFDLHLTYIPIRCTSAERQLAAMRDLEEDEFDIEDQGPLGSTSASENLYNSSSTISSSGSISLRKRSAGGPGQSDGNAFNKGGRAKVTVTADLEKMGLHTGPNVKKAVDMIDSWTLLTGRYDSYHQLYLD